METTASFTDHPITHPVSVPIFGHRIAGFSQQGETHGREEVTASVAFEITGCDGPDRPQLTDIQQRARLEPLTAAQQHQRAEPARKPEVW